MVIALVLALPTPVHAANEGDLTFELPLDLGKQGLSFPAHGQPTRYRYQPTLAPTLLGSRFSVGVPLAAVFDAPDWRFAAGLRPAVRLYALEGLYDASVWAEAEGMVTVPHPRAVIQAGLVARLLFLRIGVWGGPTTGSDGRWSLLSGLGVDLVSLVRVLGGPKESNPNVVIPGPPRDDSLLTQFRTNVASHLKGDTPLTRLPSVSCWVLAHRSALEQSTSLGALEALARGDGQADMVNAVEQTRQALPKVADSPVAARAAAQGAIDGAEDARSELKFTCP
jgi:hypothetical protein